MPNRVQRALAHRERMRRSRDHAWMVFAGLACAALFGWILLAAHTVVDLGTPWWGVAIYAAIAVVCTVLAVRAFRASRRLTRRVEDALTLEAAEEREHHSTVWDEILWRGRRG